ncbi:MAG: hypothetical protein ACQETJ_07035 [Bacteroidota bacterium]
MKKSLKLQPEKIIRLPYFIILGFVFLSFRPGDITDSVKSDGSKTIIEFKRGDILVRPNHNWFPNTGFVENGSNFGHAAIVIKGGKGTDPEKLLQEIEIFESHARNVPEEYQLRKVKGYVEGADFRVANLSFGPQYAGKRYRLRLDIQENEINKVIDYLLQQSNDVSSWRALKNTSNPRKDKDYWYCSLLIYQAFKDVLNIDLDSTGGIIVFPNDLIVHPAFDYENGRMIY